MPQDALLTVNPATLPEGTCYQTEQERFDAFAANLQVTLPGNYSTVNVGSDTPGVDDRDKPWLRTLATGAPDGVYHWFDGSWKRKHALDTGSIEIWLGSAATIETKDGGAAGAVTTQSGPFWEIVTELAAKFPVGVGAFANAQSPTITAVGTVGGEDRVTLETKNLPEVLGSLKDPYTKLVGVVNTGGTNGETAGGALKRDEMNTVIQGGTDAVDKSHNNLPPFVAVYFIRRTSRLYYSV